MNRLTTAAALVAPAILLAAVAPASADNAVRVADKRGDAQARYDLTTATIKHTTSTLAVKTKVRDLRASGTQIFALFIEPVDGSAFYSAYSVRRSNGKATGRFLGTSEDTEVDCKVTRSWRPAKDTITLSVPRSCIAGEGALKVSLAIGAGNGTAGDPADQTKTVRVAQDDPFDETLLEP